MNLVPEKAQDQRMPATRNWKANGYAKQSQATVSALDERRLWVRNYSNQSARDSVGHTRCRKAAVTPVFLYICTVETAMRLLFVTSGYPPMTGGMASRVYNFSETMHSMGIEVTVLTFLSLRRFFKVQKRTFRDGIRVIRIPSIGFKHPLDQVLTSIVGTLLICAFRSPDFIIISVPMGEPCIGAFLVSTLLRKRVVMDVMDEWEEAVIRRTRRYLTRILYRFYKSLFDGIYQKSTLVATVSPTLVKRVKERGVMEAFYLPNGVDVSLFHPASAIERSQVRTRLNLAEDDFALAFVGRIGWYYRIDVVIRALALLASRHHLNRVKLVAMGGGEKIQEFSALSTELSLETSVSFLGEREHKEVSEILSCCDAGVIPLDDDPIWLSAYTSKFPEYCASGLPTILSVVPGADLEQLILSKSVGFVVEPLRPEKMASAIAEALKDRRRHKRMRANARKLAIEEFDNKKIAYSLARKLELLRSEV